MSAKIEMSIGGIGNAYGGLWVKSDKYTIYRDPEPAPFLLAGDALTWAFHNQLSEKTEADLKAIDGITVISPEAGQ